MGVSTFLKLGSAATRILSKYGQRSGSIINATGTGTQYRLTLSPFSPKVEGIENIFDEQKGLSITDFSPNGSPVRPHQLNVTGCRRTLSGRMMPYRKYSTIDIDITVIGNSLDYYKLSMLAMKYVAGGVKQYSPIVKDAEVQGDSNTQQIPLLDLSIISASAPGSNIKLSGGVITDADTVLGIDGNAKISDKTFSFSFASVETPSWSEQKYDQSGMSWYENFY